MKQSKIYWVKQGVDNDSCRLLSLNNFYQRAKFSPKSFAQKCSEFDAKFGGAGSALFTSFCAKKDGTTTCVIDYIVECDKFHCVVCHAGEEEPILEETEFSLEAVFVFDFEHMWVERLIEVKQEKKGLGDWLTFGKQEKNRWYNLDSRGSTPAQIKKPGRNASLGRIFVFRRLKMEANVELSQPKKEKKRKEKKAPKEVFVRPKRQGDPE